MYLGMMTVAVLVRNTEELDEVFALGHLLFVQTENCTNTGKGHGQTERCRPDHRAVPLCRVKICSLGKSEMLGNTDALEHGIVGGLDDIRVSQCCYNIVGELFTVCKVNDLRRMSVHAVAEEQNLKIIGFRIGINSRFTQINIRIGLYIN